MDVSQLIGNVGFPIGLAVYLLQQQAKTNEKIIKALQAATSAIEASNENDEKVIKVLNEVKGWQQRKAA